MSSKQVLVLTRLAMGMALSYLGSLINIPLVISTLSLDSLPGYTYALLFSGWEGALVAAFGHFLTAWLRGFPFSLPVHIIIMAGMALAAWVLAWLTRRVKTLWAALGALLINAVFLPLLLIPILGVPFFIGAVFPLTLVSAINLALALIISDQLSHRLFKKHVA